MKKGFTLIELMVVIAIIAILATVVLVALQGARDAAQDSKKKSAISQVRSLAETYKALDGDYRRIETPGEEFQSILNSFDENVLQYHVNEKVEQGQIEYCVSTRLESGTYFCADSSLFIGEIEKARCCSSGPEGTRCNTGINCAENYK